MSGNSYTKISALTLVPLCLALPQGVGIAVGGSTIDFPRICCVIFLLLSAFLMAKKATGFGRILSDKCLILLVVVGAISAFLNSNPLSALKWHAGTCAILYSGYLVRIYGNSLFNEPGLKKVIRLNCQLCILFGALACTEVLLGANMFDPFRTSYAMDAAKMGIQSEHGFGRTGFKAAMGPYASQVPFGYLLAAMTLLSLSGYGRTFGRSVNILSMGAFGAGFIGVLATGSRGAFMGMLIGLFVIILLNMNRKRLGNIFGIGVLCLVMMIVSGWLLTKVKPTYLNEYIFILFEAGDDGEDNILHRLTMSYYLFKMLITDFDTAFLFGHGPGRFQTEIYGAGVHKIQQIGIADYGISVQVLYEYGVVGLTLFFAFVGALLSGLFKFGVRLSNSKRTNGVSSCLLGALVCFFVAANGSNYLDSLFGFYLLCGLAGGIIAYQLRERRQYRESSEIDAGAHLA